MIAELLVNLPGQSRGNIGEIVGATHSIIHLEMVDGSVISVMPGDVRILENEHQD